MNYFLFDANIEANKRIYKYYIYLSEKKSLQLLFFSKFFLKLTK